MRKPESAEELGPLHPLYVSLPDDLPFAEVLASNTLLLLKTFKNLPATKWDFTYDKGKWTVKEVLQHIIDTERVMSFRALNALRGQSADEIPGMDQVLFAANVNVSKKSPQDLIAEFEAVRNATTYLFKNVTEAESKRTVFVLGKQASARALAFMMVGHVMHHVAVLKEKYL